MYDKKGHNYQTRFIDWQSQRPAFLASAVAIRFRKRMGSHLSMPPALPIYLHKHPILIYAETEEQLRRAFIRAKERDKHWNLYKPLFNTKNEENHIEIGKSTDEEQDLVGIMYEKKKWIKHWMD
jgi:hypothetical protein